MNKRKHDLTVTVRFSRPISVGDARAVFRNNIYGESYDFIAEGEICMKIGRVSSRHANLLRRIRRICEQGDRSGATRLDEIWHLIQGAVP